MRAPRCARPSTARLLVLLALAVTLALSSLVATSTPAAAASGTTRVQGGDRIGTAVQVARTGWSSAPRVVLATASDYPDAIAAAAFARSLDAPVLLTYGRELHPEVRSTLGTLGAREVILLGGQAALGDAVEAELRAMGLATDRVAGGSRFATAAELAKRTYPDGRAPVVAVALGSHRKPKSAWPDALSAASLAGLDRPVPTLLTTSNELVPETRAALSQLSPQKVLVLGGPGAVSDGVVAAIRSLGLPVERAEGATRYTTAIEVARTAMDGVAPVGDIRGREAVFVSGENFPDALGAGALAARKEAPLLLVPSGRLADSVDAFVRGGETAFNTGLLVGGSAAVKDFVKREIDAALTGSPRPQPPPPPPPPCPPNSAPGCAYTYRIPIATWERLAQCESGGNWGINTGNGYYGGIQFSLASWRAVGGRGYPHQNSKWEQIYRGELLQARQGWGAWPACTRKLGIR